VELLIETALRDERLKHQMSAILTLQNEMKGKGGRPPTSRMPTPLPPTAQYAQPLSAFPTPVPTPQQPAENAAPRTPQPAPLPPPAIAVPPPPADPSQYIPPELSQSPQKNKPAGSLLRRFFKGGQQ